MLAPGAAEGEARAFDEPVASGGAAVGASRFAGEDDRLLLRAGGAGDGTFAGSGRGAAAGERALPRGGDEERPGVREGAGQPGRGVRERRLRVGAPGARLDGRGSALPAGGGGAADGEGAGVPGPGDAGPAAPLRGDHRRGEGEHEDGGAGEPAGAGGQAAHRRGHGEHVLQGGGHRRGRIAGGGRVPGAGADR